MGCIQRKGHFFLNTFAIDLLKQLKFKRNKDKKKYKELIIISEKTRKKKFMVGIGIPGSILRGGGALLGAALRVGQIGG